MKKPLSSLVPVALIGRPHGVKGLLKVKLLVEDLGLIEQEEWLQDKAGNLYQLDLLGGGIAKLKRKDGGVITSRNDIELLTNQELFIEKSALPDLDEDEFYFSDLVGLNAFSPEGKEMGTVERVHDYGAGTSLELSNGELIPFNKVYAPSVLLDENKIILKSPSYIEAKIPEDSEGSDDGEE